MSSELELELLQAIEALASKKSKESKTSKYVRSDANNNYLSVHYDIPHIKVSTVLLPKNGHTVEYRGNKLWYDSLTQYICIKDKSGIVRRFPESQAHLATKHWEDVNTSGKVFRTYPGAVSLSSKLEKLPTKHHPIMFSKGGTKIRAVPQDSSNRLYIVILPENNGSKTIVRMEIDTVVSSSGLVYQYSGTVRTNDSNKMQETYDFCNFRSKKKGRFLCQRQVDILASTLGRNHFVSQINKALREIGSGYICQVYK